MNTRHFISVLQAIFVLFCLHQAHAQGEFLPSREYPGASLNIKKSATQLISEIQSILNKQDCLKYGTKCTFDETENDYKPCCESLNCLRTDESDQYFCMCERGFSINHDGECFWPIYPNFMTVIVWLVVGMGLTVSCSYILVACIKKKKRERSLLSDLNYATFDSPSSENSVHHITSVLSPVATSQVIDRPPVYQMEEMPPAYDDAVVLKYHKS